MKPLAVTVTVVFSGADRVLLRRTVSVQEPSAAELTRWVQKLVKQELSVIRHDDEGDPGEGYA